MEVVDVVVDESKVGGCIVVVVAETELRDDDVVVVEKGDEVRLVDVEEGVVVKDD